MKKTNNNNVNINNVGEVVTLHGWVNKKRDLGGLLFIDLRDRSGIIQLVVRPESPMYEVATTLKNESDIKVTGTVVERESKNSKLATGDIEVIVDTLDILTMASDIPFEINNDTTALEDTRLKYRYLDLRREELKNNIITRHKICESVREYLNSNEFLEIETPILCRSTPEGARDYIVPSRVNQGNFYALPQSPQIFKQLLMVSGFERYYQIARCFRDEDLRADRQPEFTQIDMEMSFVDEDDVMSMTEGLFKKVFKDIKNIDLELPLMRMKYDDAIRLYGSDKPDLRFEMPIEEVSECFKNVEFAIFNDCLANNGVINALVVKNAADKYSRKDLDKLTDYVKTYKANGLFFLKYNEGVFSGSIAKIMNDEISASLKDTLSLEENDLVLIICGNYNVVKTSLGALRLKLGRDLDLIDRSSYKLLWVVDFPSFEYSEEEGRYMACHHPFTSPKDSDVDKLLNDKANCYSKAYDIVCNGYEAGGGSIRIHDQNIQRVMFEALGLSDEEIENKFGFLVEAFKYGTPPHGGLAIGLERLTMLLCGTDNIRDVIAFPKTASASCLMTSAPNLVDDVQLDTLGICLKEKK